MIRRAPLFAALLLAGCAQLPERSGWDNGPTVSELQAQHQYVAALELLKQQHARQGDYVEQRRALLDAANRYRESLFAEVDSLAARGLFAAAQLQLEVALPQLPSSPTLRRRKEQFYAERDRFVASQLARLAEIRGQNLLQEQALYEKLIGVNGDYEMQVAVERYREDAAYFAGQLQRAGIQALAEGDADRAVQLLGSANQLHPEKETADHLAAAYQELLALQNREQDQLEQRRSERLRTLQRAFDRAMAKADYQAARRHLDAAAALGIDSAEVARWHRALGQASEAAVSRYTTHGDHEYAEGRIEQALRSWQRAYELRPSAELQGRIERAQRLMTRYRELQESPVAP